MVKTLIGKDSTGVTKLLITSSGDPLNPNQASVLFDSDQSTLRIVKESVATLDQPFSTPITIGASTHTAHRSLPSSFGETLPVAPIVLCAMSRPGDTVYWTRGYVPGASAPTFNSIGNAVVAPSVGWIKTTTAGWRLGHWFSYNSTTTSVTFDGYSPRGGNAAVPYIVRFAVLALD